MTCASFEGSPREIGSVYGKRFSSSIQANLDAMVRPHMAKPRGNFKDWVRSQERLIARTWPWYLEEMEGVAVGAGVRYDEILFLNLRTWQFKEYGDTAADHGCSSLAVRLADGNTIVAGTLDDPIQLYCGPIRFVPRGGYRFVSFPITGTSWANRALNSAGLAMGISSQLLPGLRKKEGAVMQDVALRAMMQQCATTDEVREFCRQHPFTMNIVCVDRRGKMLCAHQTTAGFMEIPTADGCALTNHVADDELIWVLREKGVNTFPESPTSRPRRGYLVQFLRNRAGKCSSEEVKKLIGTRDDANPGSIHNRHSIYVTFASPRAYPNTLWIMQPRADQPLNAFQAFQV